jgi:hypothetical protein
MNFLQINNASAQQPTNPNSASLSNPSATVQSSNATQANSGMNSNSAVNSSSMNQSGGLAGSISIFSPIVNAFKSVIHVSLSTAITNAQNTLGNNSTTLEAFIHPDKGFIVYQIFALDANNNIHKIVVDPGNGRILSAQQMSLIEMMLMLHGGMMMGPGMDNGMMMGPGMDNGMMGHGMMGPGMDNGMMGHGMMGPGMSMNKPWH